MNTLDILKDNRYAFIYANYENKNKIIADIKNNYSNNIILLEDLSLPKIEKLNHFIDTSKVTFVIKE